MFQHALSQLKLLIIQYTVENWRRELGWIVFGFVVELAGCLFTPKLSRGRLVL